VAPAAWAGVSTRLPLRQDVTGGPRPKRCVRRPRPPVVLARWPSGGSWSTSP